MCNGRAERLGSLQQALAVPGFHVLNRFDDVEQ